jgi:2'-5' RNA ligase
MRTFIAVEVPEGIRKVVHDVVPTETKKGLPIKWVAFQNLHITLKFLGEIDENMKVEMGPVVAGVCRKYKPFQVRLQGLGCFPGPKNPRVLWVGVGEGSTQLCDLAAELENGLAPLGFKEEKRFHPHLTIGRIKKFCKVDDILARNISTDTFGVDSVMLFRSILKPEGPVYEELERFAFDERLA